MNQPGHARPPAHLTSPPHGRPRHRQPDRETLPRTARATIGCVIPCYDYGRFVAETIESALAQEDPYDAIVVVDDGSTDDSAHVIRRYAHRVEVVTQENRGHLGAALAGVARLHTDYVHVLDADDLADPGLVARVRPLLAKRPVKLQFQVRAVDASGAPNQSVFPSYAPGYDAAAMREDNRVVGFYQCPPTSGNVFHVPTLRRLRLEGEDPRMPLDGAGCVVMPYLGEVIALPEPLASYRLHGRSLSGGGLPPSVAMLHKEVSEFAGAWECAARLLGFDEPPFGEEAPLFVLERRQLARALRGSPPDPAETATYLRRLRQAHLPAWQRAAHGALACALLVPSRPLRRRLVEVRRSGSDRPQWVRALISRVRG